MAALARPVRRVLRESLKRAPARLNLFWASVTAWFGSIYLLYLYLANFTESQSLEAAYNYVFVHQRGALLYMVSYGNIRIFNKRLLEQATFREILLQLPVDDFVDHVGWLAFRFSFFRKLILNFFS